MELPPTTIPVASVEPDLSSCLIAIAQQRWAGERVEACLDEMDRELAVRDRIYPRWVTDGKLSKTSARDQMQRMAGAFKALTAFVDLAHKYMPCPPTDAAEVEPSEPRAPF